MTLDLQRVRDFVAHGTATHEGISVPVIITGKYNLRGTDPVECTVITTGDALPAGFRPPLELRGMTDRGTNIWIPDLEIISGRPDPVQWTGVAKLYIEGDLEEFDASEGQIICRAFLPPSPVADRRSYWEYGRDGTVTLRYEEERQGLTWESPVGKATLLDGFDVESDKVGPDDATVHIRRLQAEIEIIHGHMTRLDQILSELSQSLDDALWLLSLVGHKRLAWYEAEAVFYPSRDSSQPLRMATARRKQWLGYVTTSEAHDGLYLLVKRRALADARFMELHRAYQTSAFKDVIQRAIMYLLVSYEQGYFESHLGNVYSALETMVDGLGGTGDIAYPLPKGPFDKLAKRLRAVIREEIADEGLQDVTIKKLPELRRRAFVDRLLMLLQQSGVVAASLWPPGIDVEMELRQMIKRRDIFIHQGKTDESPHTAYVYDLERLRILVELWILKMLGYPESEINDLALNRLAH